ncbi:1187_t:CDS:1, partial [Rhizophagus irregularis]
WDSGRDQEKYEAALECINKTTGTNAYIKLEEEEKLLLISA